MIRRTQNSAARPGVILLVVLALLTLFAVVGIAFVFYAQSRADSARIYREYQLANLAQGPDTPPELLWDEYLRQLLYDLSDSAPGNGAWGFSPGYTSAMRGQSLARGIYGANYAAADTLPGYNATTNLSRNVVAYNGAGRLHDTAPAGRPAALTGDEWNFVNYIALPGDTAMHDPERYGWHAVGAAAGNYAGGFNASYTFPDNNSMFLAAVNSSGTVLLPSFFRPTTGVFTSLAAGQPGYSSPTGRYMLMRPRAADNAGFLDPTDPGGDVKNLLGAQGYQSATMGTGNDSIWMDLGSAVKQLPDGTLYKPLFAALIVDLDNRLNVNVAGNIRGGPGTTHVSNHGLGPWEMNLSLVLGTDWANILKGNGTTAGRYGASTNPAVSSWAAFNNSTQNLNGGNFIGTAPNYYSPFFSKYDYDGANDTLAAFAQTTSQITLPTAATQTAFPTFGAEYNSGSGSTAPPPGPAELYQHPQIFCPFAPGTGNTVIRPVNMRALLQNGSSGSQLASSTIGKLCPTSFNSASNAWQPNRWMITTTSNDLEVTGVTPWYWDSTNPQYTSQYMLTAGTTAPIGAAITFPTPAQINAGTASKPGSEFGADNRADDADPNATPAGLSRIDLNRSLTPYPVNATTGEITGGVTSPQYLQAVNDRKKLAADIYLRLVRATGAYDQTNPSLTTAPTQAQYDACRWLAQLAVNIVDYIDSDDIMTPFYWAGNPTATAPAVPGDVPGTTATFYLQIATLDKNGQGWVFGTEIPRLVLNEVYAEINNDSLDPQNANNGGGLASFNVNFWAELYNPFNNDPNLVNSFSGDAKLAITNSSSQTYAAYQLVVANNGCTALRGDFSNALGKPMTTGGTDNTLLTFTDWVADSSGGAPQPTLTNTAPGYELSTVHASVGGSYTGVVNQNKVLYVVGPGLSINNTTSMKYTGPGAAAPGIQVTLPVKLETTAATATATPPGTSVGQYQDPFGNKFDSGLTYRLSNDKNSIGGVLTTPPSYAMLLRRLACPGLPPQLNPAAANYNPYVTVDYIDSFAAYDGVNFINNNPHPRTPAAQCKSTGKTEPYASYSSQWPQQNQTGTANPVLHTFFAQNSNIAKPFHWLTHLDRQLISPAEILSVSSFKPHELTQQFVTGASPGPYNYYQHAAPWTNPTARIYRALDFLGTKSRIAGAQLGGRVPGKLNINTIYDLPTFQALCDTQTCNLFTATDVTNAWGAMPGNTYNAASFNFTGSPFWSLAAPYDSGSGQFPNSIGVANTILNGTFTASGAGTKGSDGIVNPYLQNQLLNKVYNNVTTRSNCFAIWLTVGFFIVQNYNPNTSPPTVQLGLEWGVPTGQPPIRHHMFGIVDRTAMTYLQLNQAPVASVGTGGIGTSGTNKVNIGAWPPGPGTGTIPGLQPGMILTIDTPAPPAAPGANIETVVVQNVDTTNTPPQWFTATFNKTHAAGAQIYAPSPGSPGPLPTFGAKDNAAVVQHYVIID
jgi:hypothetical protein